VGRDAEAREGRHNGIERVFLDRYIVADLRREQRRDVACGEIAHAGELDDVDVRRRRTVRSAFAAVSPMSRVVTVGTMSAPGMKEGSLPAFVAPATAA